MLRPSLEEAIQKAPAQACSCRNLDWTRLNAFDQVHARNLKESDLPGNSLSLADRMAIRDVVDLYFHSIDARDPTALAACFTDDVEFSLEIAGVPLELRGRDEVVETISRAAPPLSNHALSNIRIWSQDGVVRSVVYGVSIVGTGAGPGAEIHTRGLRYDDEWRCLDASADPVWKIKSRVHRPLWQHVSLAIAPRWIDQAPDEG